MKSGGDQLTEHDEKYIQWVTTLSLTIQVYLHYQLLPPKSKKSHEILRKFEHIAVQGHPRSSILVSIESSYATF